MDNERAAIALLGFKDDQEVAKTCLNMLLQPEVRLNAALASYLVFVCEGLTSPEDQAKFTALANDPAISKSLKQDIFTIAKTFQVME